MKVMRGDLVKLALDGHFEVIVHRCNCQCAMGAGIAKAIKQAFPEAYKADKATAKGSRTKLGTLSIATIELGNREITIVNGYTQFHWRGSGVLVDYAALRSVMRQLKVK
jgi:O-acetyl-ADP-ribose deacetylase (regulator of RNase III)